MTEPQAVCFCGANHIAGWCLRNDLCNHRFKPAVATGFEVCIDCGKGRPVMFELTEVGSAINNAAKFNEDHSGRAAKPTNRRSVTEEETP